MENHVKFWEEILATTGTDGWKNLSAELEVQLAGINFEACTTIEQLMFLKGRAEVFRFVLSTPEVARAALAILEEQQAVDDGER